MLRKTKIICTLGPATEDEAVLRRLMLGGMNAARFNFSHCTHEDAAKKLEAVTRLRRELGLPIATILDTKGPEIRVKTFQNGPIELEAGATFTLTTREVEGDDKIVSITYKDLPKDLKAGARVLIDDGLVEPGSAAPHVSRILPVPSSIHNLPGALRPASEPGSAGHYWRYSGQTGPVRPDTADISRCLTPLHS